MARISIMACGLALVWLAQPAWGLDLVTRKSQKTTVSGDVSSVTKSEVNIKPKSGDEVKIPVNDIDSITWSGEPSSVGFARRDAAGGRLQKAFDEYTKAAESAANGSADLKAEIEFGQARTLAQMALADASKVDAAIKRLESFKSERSENWHYYEAVKYLGELYTIKKDDVKARVNFEALAKAPWKDTKMNALNATGHLLINTGKPAEALTQFDQVIGMSAEGPLETAAQQEAMLGKARLLLQESKVPEANKLVDEVIAKASPEDAHVQAEAFVRQGDCLQAQGKDKDALLAYLHVDVLFPAERALHAESLFHLTRLWNKVGQSGRAAEARDKLESDYPNSDWTRQLKSGGDAAGM